MDAQIMKEELRASRLVWLTQQRTYWRDHWLGRMSAEVLLAAKMGKNVYTHTFAYSAEDDEAAFPMEEPFPRSLVDTLTTAMVSKFPDSSVTFQNNTLTIDWSG